MVGHGRTSVVLVGSQKHAMDSRRRCVSERLEHRFHLDSRERLIRRLPCGIVAFTLPLCDRHKRARICDTTHELTSKEARIGRGSLEELTGAVGAFEALSLPVLDAELGDRANGHREGTPGSATPSGICCDSIWASTALSVSSWGPVGGVSGVDTSVRQQPGDVDPDEPPHRPKCLRPEARIG